MDLKKQWEEILDIIESEVTAVSFDLWLKTLEPLDIIDNKLILLASSTTAKNQLLKLHKDKLNSAIERILDGVDEFVAIAPDEKEEFFKNLNIEKNNIKQKENKKSLFNEKYSFDNFVVGKSNQFVYAAARSVAEEPGIKYNPLFFYGGVGLGKTHLLHAIGNYLTKTRPELNIVYVTCEKFTNDYIESLRSGKDNSLQAFRGKYRNVDVLMIDDIQFISNKTGTQEEFFHTFNDLYQNNKQIIISSDRPPKEIATLEDRLRSRFTSGLIQDIQQPDFETRLAILQKKAQIEKYNIDNEVLSFIAEKIDTNIRELEGMLSKVVFYASLLGKPSATMNEAMEAMKDHIDNSKEKITADKIINVVCNYYNIKKEDLVGKKKNKEIVEPRQICMYLISEILELPLASIGSLFGGRDHTTVIHARDKVSSLIKTNYNLKTTINDLKAMIKVDN